MDSYEFPKIREEIQTMKPLPILSLPCSTHTSPPMYKQHFLVGGSGGGGEKVVSF